MGVLFKDFFPDMKPCPNFIARRADVSSVALVLTYNHNKYHKIPQVYKKTKKNKNKKNQWTQLPMKFI